MQVLSVEVAQYQAISFNCTIWNLLACSEKKQKYHPHHFHFCFWFWWQPISEYHLWFTMDSFGHLSTIHRDLLFIKSTNNDLITGTFASEIRLKLPVDDFSTYIFTDAENHDRDEGKLGNNARVLISFVGPTSGKSLILRLKHSGGEDGPLAVTLGSTMIQLNPSSKSSLTVDDITLYPVPGPSKSDYLSFGPGIRNDIFIQFRGTVFVHGHFLHDIDLLDEDGGLWRNREIRPHSASLSILSD